MKKTMILAVAGLVLGAVSGVRAQYLGGSAVTCETTQAAETVRVAVTMRANNDVDVRVSGKSGGAMEISGLRNPPRKVWISEAQKSLELVYPDGKYTALALYVLPGGVQGQLTLPVAGLAGEPVACAWTSGLEKVTDNGSMCRYFHDEMTCFAQGCDWVGACVPARTAGPEKGRDKANCFNFHDAVSCSYYNCKWDDWMKTCSD